MTRALIENDRLGAGVRIALLLGDPPHSYIKWAIAERVVLPRGGEMHEPSYDDWLHLNSDEARALYDALAEHFGHTGHDMRALRKDHDAERKRVDHFIEYLTRQ